MEDMSHPTKVTIALDREFHTAVAGILGNAVLVRFIGELFDQRMNPYFELLSSYFENRDSWRAAAAEHRAVRDAIAARDPERAKTAMQEHLRLSQLRFSRNFGERSAAREVAE
jgi:DNA-binding GntR family transcriptional regulator